MQGSRRTKEIFRKGAPPPDPRRPRMRDALFPVLVMALLSLPRLRLGFFWDDYYYLTSAQSNPLTYLLPRPGAMSYRPIPEGLDFLLLVSMGPSGRFLGHLINLVLLAVSIILLASLTSKLAGNRAGLIAGLTFAALGAVPTLVSWTSCAPDVFAIAFILVALYFRHSGRLFAAFLAAACALFSKESVLLLFPALVLWDRVLGRKPDRLALNSVMYGGLALAWAAIHPAIHSLVDHGFRVGGTGYLGLGTLGRSALYLGRYLLTLINVPITGLSAPWPDDLSGYGAAALLVLLLALWFGRRGRDRRDAGDGLAQPGAAALAALLAVPSLLLPAVLVGRWNPYFACIPALGTSFFAGVLASRVRPGVAAAALAAYLALGVWSRGVSIPGGLVLTERDCVEASESIQRVERNFRYVHPSLPHGSQVLLSVAESGLLGTFGTMVDGQALRIWYRDPTLETRPPELRRAGAPTDFLFRITGGQDIIDIDPDSCMALWSGVEPQWLEVSRPIRSYARGVAASGDTDRAVRILERLHQLDSEAGRGYDLRLAGMVLLAAGRPEQAQQSLNRAGVFDQSLALDMIAKLYAAPTGNSVLNSSAFRAFGVSPSDSGALRYLMRKLVSDKHPAQAEPIARMLQRLAPGDYESGALLANLMPRRGPRRDVGRERPGSPGNP